MDRTNWGVLVGAVAAFTIGLIGGCAPTAPHDEPVETEDALTNCGNGVCETGENCAGCPGDCGRCTGDHCGDGVCKKKETCVTCELDCGACSGCGNGVCEGSETCANCPLDCAKCQGEFCGNGVCGRRESCTACARDCCPAPQCASPNDCATNNECISPTCVNGRCGTANVPDGNLTSNQVPGDCKNTVCNGMGGTKEVNANDDLPADDMNPCTEPSCTDGVPGTGNTPIDTSCGGSNFCDGNGNCVQCTSSAGGMIGCSNMMNECAVGACTMGTCGTTFTAAGTPISTQVPGDCKSINCDGMGGTTQGGDPMDVPADDGNPCTLEVCNPGGTPAHPNAPDGTECVPGGMGEAGHCQMGVCLPPG